VSVSDRPTGEAGGVGHELTALQEAVARVLSSLEEGDVVTYGEVAMEAGYPGTARAVGRFLAQHGRDYPWWRVVTASGRLVPGHEREHARRLQAEGVAVVDGRVVAHDRHGGPQRERMKR
jgi:methylated-DNA-protein-cysteine methyltransferase-like protein